MNIKQIQQIASELYIKNPAITLKKLFASFAYFESAFVLHEKTQVDS
jgi:hypothetical protein